MTTYSEKSYREKIKTDVEFAFSNKTGNLEFLKMVTTGWQKEETIGTMKLELLLDSLIQQ